MAVYGFSRAQPGEDVFTGSIAKWVRPGYILTLITNVLVTSMIAGRIWWLSKDARSYLARRHTVKYYQAIAVIIESGAIYSSSLVLMLILYTIKTHAERILYDAISQIVGIAPTLIIVRVGLGIKQDFKSGTTGDTQFSTAIGFSGHDIERGSSLHRSSALAVVIPRNGAKSTIEGADSTLGEDSDRSEGYYLDRVESSGSGTVRVKKTRDRKSVV